MDPLLIALSALAVVLALAVGFVAGRVGRGGAASARFEDAVLRAETVVERTESEAEQLQARAEAERLEVATTTGRASAPSGPS